MTTLLSADTSSGRDVLVLGSGTVGGAVSDWLGHRHGLRGRPVTVPWASEEARRRAFEDLWQASRTRWRDRPLSVVWAAGRAGFSAGPGETALELAAFRDVVELAERVLAGSPDVPHAFHLVSSAGGLYEGRIVRSPVEAPSPVRSYGRMKLAQEEHALSRLPHRMIEIHRPSSVYPVRADRGRPGLVGTLVRNGLLQRETRIVGSLGTLRDYVTDHDVGRFVADRAWAGAVSPGRHLLVSGHAASILRVLDTVRSVLRRPLHVRIAESWNAQDIAFAPSARATGFHAAPLVVGVRRLHDALLGQPLGRP